MSDESEFEFEDIRDDNGFEEDDNGFEEDDDGFGGDDDGFGGDDDGFGGDGDDNGFGGDGDDGFGGDDDGFGGDDDGFEDEYTKPSNIEDNINIFGDEYNVSERTGTYYDDNKKYKKFQDPIERFKSNINAISIDLINYYPDIHNNDINFMINTVSRLNKPEYKNASAYVLGYLAIKNSGNKLNKTIIFKIFDKCLPYIQDKSVKKADIIRYARLWLSILS